MLKKYLKSWCTHTLCVKPPDRNQEMGQDLRYTFLKSLWHTDAKKIPEKLIYWRHLACFFQKTKFFWKNFFLAKSHQEGPKMIFSQKNFFWKKNFFLKKHLEKFHNFFFRSVQKKFFLSFLVIFQKKKFMSRNDFGPILMGFH